MKIVEYYNDKCVQIYINVNMLKYILCCSMQQLHLKGNNYKVRRYKVVSVDTNGYCDNWSVDTNSYCDNWS